MKILRLRSDDPDHTQMHECYDVLRYRFHHSAEVTEESCVALIAPNLDYHINDFILAR